MIAGGGTGGHIYPAIAIGRALVKLDPALQIRFVGTAAGLEKKIMTRENLDLDLIYSGQLNFSGNIVKKLKTILKIPIGLLQSFWLILKYRPIFVLGVGGYASAPFVLMSALMGRKTALWEPNAHPGMANRLLSRFTKKAYLVFQDAQKYLKNKKTLIFGMPLREEIEILSQNANSSEKAHNKTTVLCFGGSQGSVFLNEKFSEFILNNPELHDEIQFIHQTGTLDFEKMKIKYQNLKCVQVSEFIYDMPTIYNQSHILICRGGASSIAEAAAFGVVPIIIPIMAADNHQLRNAEVVVKSEAGFLIKQNEFNKKEFSDMILKLKNDKELRNRMHHNLKKLAPRNAAVEIAKDIVNEIR